MDAGHREEVNRPGTTAAQAPQLEAAVLSASPLVRRWIWQPEIDSTQRLACELARGEGPGLVVLADGQSAGHGREGRGWFSPRGAGLWLSIIVGSDRPPAEWPILTSLAALAVRRALAAAVGLRVGLKWPNDLICRGRKIAGVLADVVAWSGGGPAVERLSGGGPAVERLSGGGPATVPRPGGENAIVLGLGLNIAQREGDFPAELRGRATSVRIETGADQARAPLLEALLDALACGLRRFEAGGTAAVRPELLAATLLLGRRVTVRAAHGDEVTGLALDVGEVGELVLENAAGERTSISGGTVLAVDPPLAQES